MLANAKGKQQKFDSYSRREQCIDHIPQCHSGLSRARFFRQPFSKLNSWIRKADALKTYAVSKCPKRQLTLYTSNMIIGKCINSRQYLRLSPENPNGQGFLTVLPFSVLIQEIFFNNSLSQYSPSAFAFITGRAENNLLDFKPYQL